MKAFSLVNTRSVNFRANIYAGVPIMIFIIEEYRIIDILGLVTTSIITFIIVVI